MSELTKYSDAVKTIKTAILQGQYEAAKGVNRNYVEYVIQDYSRPMGVATYKTLADMPERLRNTLPDVEEMCKMLEKQ